MPQFTFQVFLLLATSYLVGVVIGFIIRSIIGNPQKAVSEKAQSSTSENIAAIGTGVATAATLATASVAQSESVVEEVKEAEPEVQTDDQVNQLVNNEQQGESSVAVNAEEVISDTSYQEPSEDLLINQGNEEIEAQVQVEEVTQDYTEVQPEETYNEPEVSESKFGEPVDYNQEIQSDQENQATDETQVEQVHQEEVTQNFEHVQPETSYQEPEILETQAEEPVEEVQSESSYQAPQEELAIETQPVEQFVSEVAEETSSHATMVTEAMGAAAGVAAASASDNLKSVANKGRVVGSDESDDGLVLENLSDGDFARLVKDRPVQKTNIVKARVSRGDDLKQIKGIGIIAESQLKSMGIKSYSQIADWSDKDVTKYDRVLKAKGKISSEKWVDQAKNLTEE